MSRPMKEWIVPAALAGTFAGACLGRANAEETYPYREIRAPQGHVEHVAFSPDGALMAGGAGPVVVVWNVADGKEVQRMQLPDKQIYHRVAFADDGKTLVWNGREDPMVRIFDVKTGKQLREFRQPNGPERGAFSSRFLAYSPDGKRMAFNGANFFQGLDVLDVAGGEVVLQLKEVDDCRGCAFSADGKMIATVSGNGAVRIWGAAGKLLKELRAGDRFAGSPHGLAAFSADGQWLAAAAMAENSLSVWNVRTGKLTCTVAGTAFFRTAFFSQDDLTLLCVPAGTEQAVLHNLVAEKDVHVFDPPSRLAHFAAFTPDCKRVAVIGPSSDGGSSGVAGQLSIYLYDLPADALDPSAAHIDDAPLDDLWADLSSDNDLRLQLVLKAFRAAPKQTVELFGKNMQPVSKEAGRRVEGAVADLDDDAFPKRDAAMKELQSAAHDFAPLLEAKLSQAPAGETRNRLAFVLKQMREEKEPDTLRAELRAVAFLEQMGTPEARDLLGRLAEGAPQARLTVEARAALDRLKSKSEPPPP